MSHPNAITLEALALGESPAGAADHVATCEACRAYVERVRTEMDAPRSNVVPLVGRVEGAARRRRSRAFATVAVPFAIAASLLLVLKRPEAPAPIASTPSAPPSASATEEPLAMAAPEPGTRFKGGLSLAVVRERGGDQTRFTGAVPVRSGDRLRLEVALDRTEAILAAVLGDDGSWLELMAEGARDAGTHLSERSARVDASPTGGVIVVGRAEDVRRARATRDTRGLTTIRIEVEP